MATQTAQLEQETEEVRADLAHTLEELRGRMTPGHIVDQAWDYARHSEGAELVANFRHQVVQNPLALGLIGAGLTWLMMPARGARSGQGDLASEVRTPLRASAADTRSGLNSAADAVGDAGHQALSKMSDAKDALSEQAAATGEAISDGYSRISRSASDAVSGVSAAASNAKASMSSAGHKLAGTAAKAQESFLSACREQPLILAGLGLAIGAALGLTFRRTEAEDRVMGDMSDQVKRTAQEFAEKQVDAAKDAAHEAIDQAGQKASEAAADLSQQDQLAAGSDDTHAHQDKHSDADRMKVYGKH